MTEEMLEDLMSSIDLDLISGDFMEQDLERKRAAWLATFIREKNWRRDAFEASVQQQKEQNVIQGQGQQKGTGKKKRRASKHRLAISPLSYDWGEAIRTDLGGRLHAGVNNVKRKAAAVSGFLYGVLTMAVVALSFLAIVEKKRKGGLT